VVPTKDLMVKTLKDMLGVARRQKEKKWGYLFPALEDLKQALKDLGLSVNNE
jgi:hypothetical protein